MDDHIREKESSVADHVKEKETSVVGLMTVDGLALPIGPGDTILAACRRAGVTIPTLCYHPGLEPYGACRLCVVEVTHGGHPDQPAPGRVVASCTTPAQPDIQVSTRSARVLRVRRAVIAFLLERCPRSETLQQLAEDLGVPPPPGARAGPTATPAAAAPPTPVEPPAGAPALPPVPPELEQACVLCGRCVQACEKLGHFAIGFAGRSVFRRVMAPLGASSETCAACGACAELCPTGAVRLVIEAGRPRVEAEGRAPRVAAPTAHLPAWRTTVPLATCRSCGRPLWSDRLITSAPAGRADLCPACRRKETLALAFGVSG